MGPCWVVGCGWCMGWGTGEDSGGSGQPNFGHWGGVLLSFPLPKPPASTVQSTPYTPERPRTNLPCSSADGKIKSSYRQGGISALGGLPT